MPEDCASSSQLSSAFDSQRSSESDLKFKVVSQNSNEAIPEMIGVTLVGPPNLGLSFLQRSLTDNPLKLHRTTSRQESQAILNSSSRLDSVFFTFNIEQKPSKYALANPASELGGDIPRIA
ncbi:hypothetical protein CTA2_11430 [Colletotrichum tanaceti]|uniref:Uncharacterized protein n=1 Tax=Colletotrichum tanaceti TaxID=1306861 RepID=A0A4U6XMD6_9PEZI|nr:hypothetical protein CTA2_11430 [Colletotrichum tanaceti]TKW56838.1 hypothetical protein CTA1_6377 [Colletotrichum tanaceti]